jgi:hypothetical protein
MQIKQIVLGTVALACLACAAMLLPQVGQAQDAKVATAMQVLESGANKLGPPKIEGTDAVAGKEVPAIYFGSTKMNNNFRVGRRRREASSGHGHDLRKAW